MYSEKISVIEIEQDSKTKEFIRVDQIVSVSVNFDRFDGISSIRVFMSDETNFEVGSGYATSAYNSIKSAMNRLVTS